MRWVIALVFIAFPLGYAFGIPKENTLLVFGSVAMHCEDARRVPHSAVTAVAGLLQRRTDLADLRRR